MSVLLSILAVLLALLLWLLLSPVSLSVSSKDNRCRVEFFKLMRAEAYMEDTHPNVRVRIPFKSWNWDLVEEMVKPKRESTSKAKVKPQEKKKVSKKERKGKIPPFGIIFKSVRDMLRTFRVRRMYINIDTDDFALNARLIPAFEWVNYRLGGRLKVNFRGRNEIDVLITNRMYRVIGPAIRLGMRLRKY